MGLCLLAGVGAVAAFAVLTAAGFVLMACAALFTVTMLAHIQAQTPATLVGKVVSLLLTVSLCAQPAGQALYGVLLEQLAGGEGWVLLGAACGAMIVAVAARRVAWRRPRRPPVPGRCRPPGPCGRSGSGPGLPG